MNTLPSVQMHKIGDDAIQSVNARDLHAFLEVGKDFSTWTKGRIEQYGFVEGHDFVSFDAAPQNGGAGNRGHRVEFAISLDMAKELAMVERNEKGKQARRYFLDCERQVRAQAAAIPQTLPEALRLAADEAEKRAAAEEKLAIAAPKALAFDRIATETEGAVCLRAAAKLTQVPKKQFLQLLNSEGWIFRHHHSHTWMGRSDRERAGLLELKRTRVTRDDGTEKNVEQVLVTPRGLAKIAELIQRKHPGLGKAPPQ